MWKRENVYLKILGVRLRAEAQPLAEEALPGRMAGLVRLLDQTDKDKPSSRSSGSGPAEVGPVASSRPAPR
jgi:hypothetical protein